ncbi:MAG: hypothetical protein RLZZ282_1108, partial [Verrucomicrobiota bacterium]
MNPLQTARPDSNPKSCGRGAWQFLLIFLMLAAGIVATGTFYYRNYERNFRAAAEQQLAAIADLKVSELDLWRKERLGDAAITHDNPAFTQLVRRFLTLPADAGAKQQLLAWLAKYPTHFQYDRAVLLDGHGEVKMSAPESPTPIAAVISERVADVLRSGQPVLQDFFRNEHDQRVYLALLIPLHDEADAHRPLGVLVLSIDPALYLYPFIAYWPGHSASAETLLIRREGQESVFLNELRFQSNTALTLRIPLTNINIPAVKAALGQEGTAEGVDYRGMPVFAAYRPVPDSPWFLVARRDTAEVFAPLRTQLWQVIALIGVLLFGAGTCVDLVWRQQRLRFYREQAGVAEALRESNDYLENLFNYANAPIIVWNPQFQITRFNHAFESLTGSLANDVIGKSLAILFPPAQVARSMDLIKMTTGGERWDTVEIPILHHNGDIHTVLWNSATVFAADGKSPVATIAQGHDITDRKLAELAQRQSNQAALNLMCDAVEARERAEHMSQALRASETKFRAVAELSPMAIYASRGTEQIGVYANIAFTKIFGFSLADVPTVGTWWLKAFPDENYRQQLVDQWTKNIQSAEKNQSDVPILECLCCCHDGSTKNIAWVGKTIGDEFWAFGYDLTERMQSENRLLQQQALLTQTETLGRVGGWEFDIATELQTWTTMVYDIHELESANHPTVSDGVNFYTPASRPIIERAVQRAIEQGEPFDLELEITTAKGNRRSVHSVGRADLARGKVSGFIQDITAYKEAQEALHQS